MHRVSQVGNIHLIHHHNSSFPQCQGLRLMARLRVFCRFLLLIVVCLCSLSALAQRSVTGKVTDSCGAPLAGVSVAVNGEKVYATTDAQGRYTISPVSNNAVLVFSYIGMVTHKDAVGQRSVVDVRMMDNTNTISEVTVVSTGYQHISRERSTAAYGFVDSTTINRQMHADLSSALEGKVAGLRTQINPNTGEQSVILRGVGTFSNDVGTSPLIVIDDMPTTMTLDEVNPYNVESITVLKDAAAASIYGSRAANGVIVITTKNGKDRKVNVNVNTDWFITSKPSFKNLDLASSSDIIDYQTDVYNARVAQQGSVAGLFSNLGTSYYSPLFQLYRDRDEGHLSTDEVNSTLAAWRGNDYYDQYRRLAWRTAVTQRYNVSLSQKMGRSSHFASFNYDHDNNRTLHDKANKFALYFKSKYNVASWLNVSVGLDAKLNHDNTPNGYDYNTQERYMTIVDADGNRVLSPYANVSLGSVASPVNGSTVAQFADNANFKSFGFNVLDALSQGVTQERYIGLRPFVNAEVRFLRSFRYNLLYQYEWNQRKTEFYDAEDDYLMRTDYNFGIDSDGKVHIPSGGRYYSGVQNNSNYTFRNQLSFDRSFRGGHLVNALMGMEFRQNNRPRLTEQLMYGYNPVTLTSERMDWESLATTGWTSAVTDRNITLGGLTTKQTIVRHRYASFYANAGYTYKYRYNVTGSIRWDEADLFGLDTNDQHHPLWSVGAGWTISGEKFMCNIAWIDFLKLRATYGVNGNVDQTSTTYFVATYKTLSNPIRTTYLSYTDDDLPNPKLRWEKTATTNIGVDFRILNSRLSGNIEYYNRHASDLLVRRYMDATLGLTSRVVNNGEMRNRGVEVNLTAVLFRNKDWDITAGLTYAHNSNKMLKVDHSAADVASNFITSPTNYFMEGTSYNTLWAYRLSRVVNGYPVIMDAEGNELATFNSDGTLKDITTTLYGTDDLVNKGTLTPTYNGSLSLHVAWRGLEVNAFFVYSGGNKLRLPTADLSTWDVATNDILNRWSEHNAEVPRLYVDMDNSLRSYASTFSSWWRYSDTQVRSADYVKLRSISVAYTLPACWTRPLHLGATKFSLQVNNLLTWAKAGHHIDPETYGLNSGTRGMATPKTFAIGLSTSF